MGKKEISLMQIEKALGPILKENGLELYHLELVQEPAGWFLRVFIDSEDGVDLDTCARVSETLNRRLDVIKDLPEPYTLEVSSPGIERSLKRLADYQKAIGSKIYLKTFQPLMGPKSKREKEFVGILEQADEGQVIIKVNSQRMAIALESIAVAHLLAEL